MIGGAVVLILALLVSEYGAGCYFSPQNANSYQGQSIQPEDRCWIIPPAVYLEDTLAQWIMAILTIAAVWMLWRTLNLTRGANEAAVKAATAALEANKIMRQEQRPWLRFTLEPSGDLNRTHHLFTVPAIWTIDNFTNFPAIDVQRHFFCIQKGAIAPHEETAAALVAIARSRILNDGEVIYPGKAFPIDAGWQMEIDPGMIDPTYFIFGVTYRSHWGGEDVFYNLEVFHTWSARKGGFHIERIEKGQRIG